MGGEAVVDRIYKIFHRIYIINPVNLVEIL